MSKPIIEVEHLSKCYRIGAMREPYLSLREELAKKTRRISSAFSRAFGKGQTGPSDSETDFWALNDVSFSVQEGEAVGIIGRNGAGKSTLLKILSQITPPTKGQITMRGRVASLLEVGTGFHPELTGRENIFLNGAILGMTRAEIRKKFDEIVAFSEIEKFLDTPVKRYSSGMYVRLAFAVAAHLEPEILLVDEVLAVGDAQFQKKCLGKMEAVGKEGRTVFFVSHNMGAIRTLCSRVALLEKGNIQGPGDSSFFIKQYLAGDGTASALWKRSNEFPSWEGIFFEEVRIENIDSKLSDTLASTDPFYIKLNFWSSANFTGTQIAIRVTNQEGVPVFTTTNGDTLGKFCEIKKGRHSLRVGCPGSFLPPGQYTLIVASFIPGEKLFDAVEDKLRFRIEDLGTHVTIMKDGRWGVVTPILPWEEI
jgi:ABC-type polysaccharide/polyol phosphate transport system, ATPase component